MQKKFFIPLLFLSFSALVPFITISQVLTLKDAVQAAVTNYGSLRSKASYIKAAQASAKQVQREYLPDLSVSAQQDYGSINGSVGPISGFKGLSAASSGPPLPGQNWNSAFGALYLANINWDFFSFGRMKEKIKVSGQQVKLNVSDLEQEKFQQQVRVAATYLNLLAAQRITRSQENNLTRASALRDVVVARTRSGLNAGVDSSLANAEISNAKIALVRARDYELEQANQLAILMGAASGPFVLDTLFIARIPAALTTPSSLAIDSHPILKFYHDRIGLSNSLESYYRRFNYPTFTMFGILQGRGSGFDYDYGQQNTNGYTHNYWQGIGIQRSNYLLGIGVVWNLTSPLRVHQQVLSQKFTSEGLQEEYDQAERQFKTQLILAEEKIKNALLNYTEAPIQVKAATDAYQQKTVLYRNGLSNIVDATQALYALNRAETDRDIAYNNVWQALLLKAAASGDFSLFINEF